MPSIADCRTRLPPRFLEDFIAKGRASQNLTEFAEKLIAQRSQFTDEFADAYFKARAAGQERSIGTPDDFSEFCNGVTPAILDGLCHHHGVYAGCVSRGIEGLLGVRTIRLYVTYYAAWAISKWFGEQGVPGKVKASERGDFFHSVQAAAADVFVTNDNRLARWLKQSQLRVLKSSILMS